MSGAIANVLGTSSTEFKIGLKGPKLFQGTSVPSSSTGNNGDIFINSESNNENVYQKISGTWKRLSRDTLTNILVDSSTYTIQTTDEYIGVNNSGTVNLTLPSASSDGKKYIIKDESGNANTNNITIDTEGSELIDGASSYTLDNNYESITVIKRNGNFYII